MEKEFGKTEYAAIIGYVAFWLVIVMAMDRSDSVVEFFADWDLPTTFALAFAWVSVTGKNLRVRSFCGVTAVGLFASVIKALSLLVIK